MTLFYLALAWLAGIALASLGNLAWWAWLILAGAAATATVVARSQDSLRLALGCLLIASLGAARLSIAQPTFGPEDLVSYNGREIATIQGVIDDAPVVRGSITTFTIRARKIIVPIEGERTIDGLALISTVSSQDFHYGDLVSLQGNLVTPPSGAQFSYREYLARAGIFSQIRFARVDVLDHGQGNPVQAFLYALRDSAAGRIEELMPNPEASLLQGILLGSEQGIGPEVRNSFNTVSATHIIAISGANMIVIAAFLQALSGRVTREPFVSLFTILGIIIYTMFVGANPAVVRAAIMAILALVAVRLGRKTYGPASLAFGVT
jgi:competence protein ComEC